jgi:hypothetical protein
MTTIVVLFNLHKSADVARYESWARDVDRPAVTRLKSVSSFEVLKSQGLLGGGTAPYQYCEIIGVQDLKQFGADVATAAMQTVAAQFQEFADKPLFILTEAL